jgi:F-type H+-transporting ATPase subunit b
MWLLSKYLYKPLTEFLDKRTEKITKDLQSAENSREEAMELKNRYEAEIAKARERVQEIIEEAERRGKERAREIIDEAKEEALRIKERNMEEIARAKEEAMAQLKQELAVMILMIASKYMQEELYKGQQEKLIEQYINSLDKEKLGGLK